MLFGIRAHLDSMFPVCYTTSSSPECTTVAALNGKLQHWQHKGKTASPGQVLCHDLCQIAHFYQNYRNRPAPKRKKPQRVFLTGGRAAAGQTQKNQVISGKIASNSKRKTLNGAKLVKGFCGAPNRIRTCGLLIRSQTLYPAELWVRSLIFSFRLLGTKSIIPRTAENVNTFLKNIFHFLPSAVNGRIWGKNPATFGEKRVAEKRKKNNVFSL